MVDTAKKSVLNDKHSVGGTRRERMTPRERVLKALDRRAGDRVPIDLGGFQTGIHKKAYEALLEHLGLKEDIVTMDPVQQLARPSESVLQRCHADVRYLCAHAPEGFDGQIRTQQRDGREWQDLVDEFGVTWSMAEDTQLYMDISRSPLAEATLSDLTDYPWPDGGDPSRFTGVREKGLELRRETPCAIATGIGGVVYEICWYMRGLERWFMDMMEQPAFCEAMIDRMLQFWLDFYEGFLAEVGDLVDVVMIGDDLAGQSGPLFSPKLYRSIVKPRQKQVVQRIKSLTPAKVWYHTCGNCMTYLPDLIDNGVDILNPLQTSATGMDAETLKKQFGDKLVLWGGGCDSQHVLPFASTAAVRENVRANMAIFKPGGGYVFSNIHNIQAGVPAENIVAMFDAAYEYGVYE
jgi:uroporphyrinogen decarboxylase